MGLQGKQSQINEIQASYIGAFTVPLSWSISNYKFTCLLRNGLYHKIQNREPNKIGIGEQLIVSILQYTRGKSTCIIHPTTVNHIALTQQLTSNFDHFLLFQQKTKTMVKVDNFWTY